MQAPVASLKNRLEADTLLKPSFNQYLNEIKDEITSILNTSAAVLSPKNISKEDHLLSYGVDNPIRWAIYHQFNQGYFLHQLCQLIEKYEPRIKRCSIELIDLLDSEFKTHLQLYGDIDYGAKSYPVTIHIYCYAIQRKYLIT